MTKFYKLKENYYNSLSKYQKGYANDKSLKSTDCINSNSNIDNIISTITTTTRKNNNIN